MTIMASIAWCKLLVLAGVPMVFLISTLCMMSRIMIISVRRMLRETEIEKYGRPKLMAIGFQMLLSGCED